MQQQAKKRQQFVKKIHQTARLDPGWMQAGSRPDPGLIQTGCKLDPDWIQARIRAG